MPPTVHICSSCSGGIESTYSYTGMTRAPLLKFPCARSAKRAADWLAANISVLSSAFNSTSRYAQLQSVSPRQAGRLLFVRVVAHTGEAMGMNMISKGCEKMLQELREVEEFKEMIVLSLSGPFLFLLSNI